MSKVTTQTRRHNESMRDICEVHSYRYSEFLERSCGNILINGGSKPKRRKCILEYIEYMRKATGRPIVIFSDDDILEEELISSGDRNLEICSERYTKYDFFYGMQNRFISECLTRIATARGCRDTTEAQNYINSFLPLLREFQCREGGTATVDLNGMLAFAANSDEQIRKNSHNNLNSEVITSSTRGGVMLRSLLQVFAEETDNIRNTDSSHYIDDNQAKTIKNAVENDAVILVKAPALNSEIFSVYFAAELRSLIDKNFICIFDDSLMLDTEAMQTVVSMLKKRSLIDVVIACDNVVAFDEVRENSLLVNFNCNFIFLNGYAPQQDLQQVLSGFGQYTHMEAMKNKTTPARLLVTLEHGESESAQTYTRDRILLQEVNGNEAVITYGSDSHILVAERIVFNS